VNNLKGKVTMLFVTHGLPKNLMVDAVLMIGKASGLGHEYRVVGSSVQNNIPNKSQTGEN
jgi:nucleoside phosphorylase